MTPFNGKQLAQKVYAADKLNQRFAVLDAITEIIIEEYGLENLISKIRERYDKENIDLLIDFVTSIVEKEEAPKKEE